MSSSFRFMANNSELPVKVMQQTKLSVSFSFINLASTDHRMAPSLHLTGRSCNIGTWLSWPGPLRLFPLARPSLPPILWLLAVCALLLLQVIKTGIRLLFHTSVRLGCVPQCRYFKWSCYINLGRQIAEYLIYIFSYFRCIPLRLCMCSSRMGCSWSSL